MMNSQSIECECGCWNIVVKVVPPGEPCPWCGNPEPHDNCPEKLRALEIADCKEKGIPVPTCHPVGGPCEEENQCKKETGKKYNIFQFERCDCGCGTLHYVEPDEECPAMGKLAKARAAQAGKAPCCRIAGSVLRQQLMQRRKCHGDLKWAPYGKAKASNVGAVTKPEPAGLPMPPQAKPCPRKQAPCPNQPPPVCNWLPPEDAEANAKAEAEAAAAAEAEAQAQAQAAAAAEAEPPPPPPPADVVKVPEAAGGGGEAEAAEAKKEPAAQQGEAEMGNIFSFF